MSLVVAVGCSDTVKVWLTAALTFFMMVAVTGSHLQAQQTPALPANYYEMSALPPTEPAHPTPAAAAARTTSYAYQRALAYGFGLDAPVRDREMAVMLAHIIPFAYMLAAGRWEQVENAFDDVWQAHSARATWVQHGVTAAAFTSYGAGAAAAIGSSPSRGLRAVSTVVLGAYVIREAHGMYLNGASLDGFMDLVGPTSVFLAARLAVPKR